MTRVDKDGTGSIDLPEFLQMMRIKFEEEIAEEETEAPEEEADEVVGKTNIVLDGGKPGRSRETNLGNLVTDAMMSVSF